MIKGYSYNIKDGVLTVRVSVPNGHHLTKVEIVNRTAPATKINFTTKYREEREDGSWTDWKEFKNGQK